MSKKTVSQVLTCLSALLITLSIAAGPAMSQQFSDFPSLRIVQMKYEPYPAQAGKYMDLFIKVENSGLIAADNVVCELDPLYPFSLDPNEQAIREIGRLQGLKDVLLEYKVRVDSKAVNGENELKIDCGTDGLDDGYVTHTLTVDVESRRPEFAIGLVKSSPSEIKAGTDDIKLTIEIQNIGNGNSKLTIARLSLPEGFSSSGSYSNLFNLGGIEYDSSKEAVFYLDTDEGLTAGTYHAQLTLNYKEENDNQDVYGKQVLDLELIVKPSPMMVLDEVRAGTETSSDAFTGYVVRGGSVLSPSMIAQGGSGELRLTVRNDGEVEAESVSVKVFKDSSHPFDFDEVYDFVGNLEPNQSSDAVFSFTVDGNAVLKKYLVNAEIRYIEGNDVRTEKMTIPLDVAERGMDMTPVYATVVIIVVAAGLFAWKRKK